MKKYLPSLLILFSAGMIALGCNSVAYAQGDYGNYDNGYDNNYDNGYDNSYDYNDNYNDNNYDQYGNGGSGVQITFNDFYSQLAPYGRWVMDPTYGRVWIANVPNFQPYSTNGYWTYTDYGWTWVSNYDWGWAPFHYGRWGHSSSNGWFWVPGYEWGPAWVGWSSASDIYGWAPLAPGMSFGVGFSIGSIPVNFWTFMPRRYLGYHNIYNYYVPRTRYNTIIRRANVVRNYRSVRNTRYALGPQPREVARSTGRAVRTTRIVNSRSSKNTGLRNNELHVYRPSVRGGSTSSRGNVQRKTSTPSRSNATRSNPATKRGTAPTRSDVNTRKANTPQRAQRSTTTQQRAAQQRAAQQRAQRSSEEQRATQQRAQQQRASQQRANQQRAAQQRASQQRAAQQRASQQRASQQRAQRATQRAQQQQAQRAQRTQQRVERVQQRSNTRSEASRPTRSSNPSRSRR